MTIVFAILLFSLIIFFHELGHFMAAKLSGVQVNEFSMFMGPALVKWQRGETLYAIRCIPFGGYCAMEGENDDSDNPRSFGKAKWWKRLIILVAGSGMNFIIGLLLFAIAFSPITAYIDPVIDSAEPGCTVVSEDGLHVGDRILEVDGEKIYVNSDFSMILSINGGEVHDILVERDGKQVFLDDLLMQTHEFVNDDGTKSQRFGFDFTRLEPTFGNYVSFIWNNAVDTVRNVRLSLQMLFTGKAGLQDLSGPVVIVQQMSEVASSSESLIGAISSMLQFGAFIAINLSVMNLLPIPALDGGRVVALLLTTFIEKIIRRKLNPKYEAYIHAGGMVLLLLLMVFVMFKDVFSIFKG